MITDGVIKFSLIHSKDAISKTIDITDINCCRDILYKKKYIGEDFLGIGYGNISIRIPDTIGKFVITGSQTGHKPFLESDDYSIITELSYSEFLVKSKGLIKPSSESLSHAIIYDLFSGINAIIHIHSDSLWDYMLKEERISTNTVEYGTMDMIHEIKRIYSGIDIGSGSIFAMKGHQGGVISFGVDLFVALSFIESLENELSN